ncbi:TIGR03085 family protein [Corynebacterium qintianiae]|uniref:TIGR03085 family protein n=2 Tax=Corynebacterium qintianiae TaxID=2709392 RepID=A0A7T0KLK4_9CORY|nr:TIGR03085 family protein [Corynebacterium qintianiae]
MLGPMSFAKQERERLANLFLDLGPDAPTLCEGWNTRDLAIHLYIRENQPHKAGGMFVSALEPILEKETKRQLERPFEDVVRAWAAGPPPLIAPIDGLMNTAEYFVHHEDVRRGDGVPRPRDFSAAVNKNLLALAKRFGALMMRASETPVILTPPSLPPVTIGGKRKVAERGDDVIRVKGDPGELLLWVMGRNAVEVELDGDPEKVAALKVKF